MGNVILCALFTGQLQKHVLQESLPVFRGMCLFFYSMIMCSHIFIFVQVLNSETIYNVFFNILWFRWNEKYAHNKKGKPCNQQVKAHSKDCNALQICVIIFVGVHISVCLSVPLRWTKKPGLSIQNESKCNLIVFVSFLYYIPTKYFSAQRWVHNMPVCTLSTSCCCLIKTCIWYSTDVEQIHVIVQMKPQLDRPDSTQDKRPERDTSREEFKATKSQQTSPLISLFILLYAIDSNAFRLQKTWSWSPLGLKNPPLNIWKVSLWEKWQLILTNCALLNGPKKIHSCVRCVIGLPIVNHCLYINTRVASW